MQKNISVININEEKCKNCHACITACPVKYCNFAENFVIKINENLCIACGSCINACTHNARTYIDDFEGFIDDLLLKKKIIAVVDSSIAANFPETYFNLNGWLESVGVTAVFDVSFGAEITAKSYIDFLKTKNPKILISKQCSAIVTYIELYQPELIQYLAPIHSPILHTIRMIQEFYTEYSDCKIATITSCNAKKREFQETDIENYNIGINSITNYLELNKINLNDFSRIDYKNPLPETGVLISTPGGLTETIERWKPDIKKISRQVDGIENVYNYFEKLPEAIETGKHLKLIDCLSCKNGCNFGPLSIVKHKSVEEIEYWIENRRQELHNIHLSNNNNSKKYTTDQFEKVVSDYWKKELYNRTYINRSENYNINIPNKNQLDTIFKEMYKFSEIDIINCSSCGYGLCKDMATAIFNNLNKPENCHYYLLKKSEFLNNEEKNNDKNYLNNLVQLPYFEIDHNYKIIGGGFGFEDIFKENNIIGKSINEFLNHENAEFFINHEQNINENLEKVYEIKFYNYNGEFVNCIVIIKPFYNELNIFTNAFVLISDISFEVDQKIFLQKNLKNIEHKIHEHNTLLEDSTIEHSHEEIDSENSVLKELKSDLENINLKIENIITEISLKKDLLIINSKEFVSNNCSVPQNLNEFENNSQINKNAIILINEIGDIEWINEYFTSNFGYTYLDYITIFGKNILESFTNNNIASIVLKCFDSKKVIYFESYLISKNNENLYFNVEMTPILTEKNIISKFNLLISNISKIKP